MTAPESVALNRSCVHLTDSYWINKISELNVKMAGDCCANLTC